MLAAEFDLHTHTTESDGKYSPVELIQRAHDLGVKTLSITDHDTVGAYTVETIEFAKAQGVELIPGIEISTRDEDAHRFHILGLGVDTGDAGLLEALGGMMTRRTNYAGKVFDLFEKSGFIIDRDKVFSASSTVTKATIADAVLKNAQNEPLITKIFGSRIPRRGEFIEATLLQGKEFYVPSPNSIHPIEAIQVIKNAAGLAVLAHPVSGPYEGYDKATYLEKIRRLPIDGIEAFYIYYSSGATRVRIDEIADYSNFAAENGWLISAGSDFHADDLDHDNFVELGFANQNLEPNSSILDSIKAALVFRNS